ncbi:Dihydrolipoyllysine-residue acetyltransferase component of pyruvate dehydrogenase complex [Roseovarius litorisediminis]|uniref:Dihydrolipoamide acetyltransferase component of pyruvate dehydrogenase complex n=1 Tax=Roseovarius litorisediminis TaxID=1312363 RepID=A0A1Y5S4A8_9RHOB|nr:dihydrolipoamide acetyltransferase family protein [Roseovarius litorisediminis]SLN31368.1 Dihydrolipoyllysine-residue acetyltransferase component of pyruvate dehydrogenase complex [Roseovarius litorisediminis]
MSAFLMPSLGADMEAGTLVEQLVSPGDRVKHGDVIAAVETQKGVIEVEIFQDGVLEDWLVDTGIKVPVGTPLAMIRSTSDSNAAGPDTPEPETPQPHDPKPASVPREDPAPQEPAPQRPSPESPMPEGPFPEIPMPEDRIEAGVAANYHRQHISPAARRLAAQTGVDLGRLGPSTDKPITRSDIAALTREHHSAQSDMRAAIAAAMSRSKRDIPHYYLCHTVDLTKAEAFITTENATRAPDERLLLGALYLKALARAVKKVPEMNGTFEEGHFHQSEAVHAGLAIALRSGGLVAPALFDADTQSLDDLMTSMRDLIARVRAGRYRARELSEATITLSSLGDRGVDQLYGVIYPPQVAIVGVGTPALRPWVEGKKVLPRLTATLTLAADHRVSDGRRGALFLTAIAKHLQRPETL